MTPRWRLFRLLCRHADRYKERDATGRLLMTCHRCGDQRAVGLQDRPCSVTPAKATVRKRRKVK